VDHLRGCGAELLDLRLAAAAHGGHGVGVEPAVVVPGAAGDLVGGLEVGGHEDLPAAVAHVADFLDELMRHEGAHDLGGDVGLIASCLRTSSIHMPLLPASKMREYTCRSMLGSLARTAAEMVGAAESGADLVGSGGLASGVGFEAGEGSSGGGAGRFRGGMARG